jgi:5-oxopent-3-ene-1,2,5-tricarboxylate decarboxylase/2-hydroxyhepta-2,4-diene-1,7-dioate isomerase
MKLARVRVHDRVYEGFVRTDGLVQTADGTVFSPDEITWLPPVVPSKAIGLALNFADHAEELAMQPPEDPVLFFKPPSSLTGHRTPVRYPRGVHYMHYEVELVVVIGQRCRNVKAEHAERCIKGYTRDFVKNFYRPPVRAKGYDTFGPLGPYLVTADEIPDQGNIGLRAYVNNELRQQGNTSHFIRTIPELIEFISMIMTLEPDDLIWTGTPRGISHVYPGDVMRMEIDGIGALENPVISEEA